MRKTLEEEIIFAVVLNNDEITINIKTPFLWEQKNLFELFCIETDFAKYFAKCRNLFIYFVTHYSNP